MSFRSYLFAPPGHVPSVGFGSAERSQTFVGSMADQGLKAKPYRIRVRRRATCLLGRIEELFVDVKRFLHMAIYTIQVWQLLFRFVEMVFA